MRSVEVHHPPQPAALQHLPQAVYRRVQWQQRQHRHTGGPEQAPGWNEQMGCMEITSGELFDDELYPTYAAQARLAREREALMRGEGAPLIPGDELVALQGPDGRYLGRNAAEEICWVDDVSKAHKYWRKLDAVDAQVRDVKRQYGVDWIIVKLYPTD